MIGGKNQFRLVVCCLLALLLATTVSAKGKTKVIAHRGYWKTEGSAQNSIRSLELAKEIKVYGCEFDVHLTADNVPVVFHDQHINGKDIQKTSYAELKDHKLPNGETLPTLEQYLKRAKKVKRIKLIFELKSHATPERDREAHEGAYQGADEGTYGQRAQPRHRGRSRSEAGGGAEAERVDVAELVAPEVLHLDASDR